jgi:hypothetical protein
MANKEHLKIIKQGVKVWNQWREENPLVEPDLSGASLSEADLFGSNLSWTNLSEANLGGANLCRADLSGADLSGTDLREAYLGLTIFADLDLSVVKGLDTVIHALLSYISIDTIYRSHGKIPPAFLRGAGVPDDFITYMSSLTGKANKYYSCFISYSSKDDDFAQRLHTDLQAKGVPCFFAPKDLKIGDKFRPRIHESIQRHDKLLVVLSGNSIGCVSNELKV